jgi:acyl-CoA synthetase (AMP-forming)/AMP-acid ligase II
MVSDSGPSTIPARLALRALERPGDPALTLVGVGHLTYAAWDRDSDAACHGLRERGVRRDERVVLVADLPGLLDFAVAYVAVQKAGGVPVPVPRAAGADQLNRVLAASDAVGLVGQADGMVFDGWRADLADLPLDDSPARRPRRLAPYDTAELLFTSGTTGEPKGVAVSHENLLFTHSETNSTRPTRVVLHALSPGTQVGQGLLLQPLDGAPHHVVALPAWDPRELLKAAECYRASQLVLVPVMALSLIQHGIPEGVDVSSIKGIRTTSAPIAPAALARLAKLFPAAAIDDHYSTTQAWPARVRIRYDPGHPGSVGRNQGPAELRIVGEDGQVVPPDTSGLVEMRLPDAPRRRYADSAHDDDGTFQPDGWVRTGDVGRLDSEGYLYLLDRVGDDINAGGLKIDTLAVERVIADFPGVAEAAVVGLPSPTLGQYPVAAIIATADLDLDALGTYLEQRLASTAPRRLLLVDDLPRNTLGKVLKRELRAQLASAPNAEPAGPDDELLATLRAIWADALGVEPNDGLDFAAQGGTSLSAARIVGRVREELGAGISHRALYDAANLLAFAASVREAPAWEADDLGPIGPATPLSDEDV